MYPAMSHSADKNAEKWKIYVKYKKLVSKYSSDSVGQEKYHEIPFSPNYDITYWTFYIKKKIFETMTKFNSKSAMMLIWKPLKFKRLENIKVNRWPST